MRLKPYMIKTTTTWSSKILIINKLLHNLVKIHKNNPILENLQIQNLHSNIIKITNVTYSVIHLDNGIFDPASTSNWMYAAI